MDEILDSEITLLIGNQWFWSYEYSDYVTEDMKPLRSFMIPDTDLRIN
jgi:cytochrome c oxidase subunit 2